MATSARAGLLADGARAIGAGLGGPGDDLRHRWQSRVTPGHADCWPHPDCDSGTDPLTSANADLDSASDIDSDGPPHANADSSTDTDAERDRGSAADADADPPGADPNPVADRPVADAMTAYGPTPLAEGVARVRCLSSD